MAIEQLLVPVATALSGFAVIVGVLVVVASGSLRTALQVFVDLLLAAGLLRLAAADSWSAIGTAAAVIAVRKVAATALRGVR